MTASSASWCRTAGDVLCLHSQIPVTMNCHVLGLGTLCKPNWAFKQRVA